MPRTLLLTFLFSIFLITRGFPAHAQNNPDDDGDAQEAETGTPGTEAAPQPGLPEHISTIMVDGNHLSVEFVNVNFGEVLQAISRKVGFRLEGSSTIFNKKLTTKFTDLGIDAGIIKLFSLVGGSNYLISYNADGSISQLKLFSMTATPGTGAVRNVFQARTPGTRPSAPPLRAWRSRRRRAAAAQQAAVPEATQPAPQSEENTGDGDPFD